MQLWRIDESSFNLRVFNKQFVGLPNQDQGTGLIAVSDSPGSTETFRIVRNDGDQNRVRIQASNGLFLQVIVSSGSIKHQSSIYLSHIYIREK